MIRVDARDPADEIWLDKLRVKETFMVWEQFRAQLVHDKMVHMATDSGAEPNPVAAGWGALIRQNGKVTWFWGHYDHATNNAMELRAVTEMLTVLPEGMYVWVSTDSAYVKKGITEWMS
jgi:ribonuclease HI